MNFGSGTNFLTNVTIYTNTAISGGGIYLNSGSATLTNTIVADNGGGNCDGFGFTSNGHNLDSANVCSFGSAGDLINTNPHLAPLANNGGATLTHALRPGSIAIDHGRIQAAPQPISVVARARVRGQIHATSARMKQSIFSCRLS
jgi:hypothetical protein